MTVPSVKKQRNAQRTAHPVAAAEVVSTRHHAWALARSLGADAVKGGRILMLRRNEVTVISATVAYTTAFDRWPLHTVGATVVIGWPLWHWRLGPRVREAWFLRGNTKWDVYVSELFKSAGMNIPPKVKRDAKGRAEAWRGERSWRIELLVPQGAGVSARALCAMWPQLKTEVGEGCIRVNLHERTGNHVTLLIVWSRDADERAVPIDAETLIIVRPTRRFPDLTYNAGLDGWVLPRFAHAREWTGTPPYGVVPTVIDAFSHELDEPDEDPDDDLEDAPGESLDDEGDVDKGEWDDDPYADPGPSPMWGESPQVMGPVSGSDVSGGGEGSGATPPPSNSNDSSPSTPPPIDPFQAPPSGPIVSAGLFAPTVPKAVEVPAVPAVAPAEVPEFRPPGAGFGTATGDLWDLIEGGARRSTKELAEAVGMASGSAGNALSRWRRMGLVACTDGEWHVTVGATATVPTDGDEEAGSGGA